MQASSSLLGRLELTEFLIRSGILITLLLLFRDMTRLVAQNGTTSRWLQLVFSSLGLIVCWRWVVTIGQLAGFWPNSEFVVLMNALVVVPLGLLLIALLGFLRALHY